MGLNCSRLSLALSFFLAAVACVPAAGQTDVALSLYGAFSSATSYGFSFEHQNPANAAGGFVEFRHIRNPLVGYEAAYSFNRANQVYSYTGTLPAGLPSVPAAVSANAHEITGDWVFSAHAGKLRPFALVGAGLLLTEPTGGQSHTQSFNTAVYVYGVGLDWRLLPHIGLRLQYRGNVYKAPSITNQYGSPDVFTHTAEPMIGADFKF